MGRSLLSDDDKYKGTQITRVNTKNYAYRSPDTLVKYMINYMGVNIYFKTQADVTKFIDKITEG